VLKVEGTTIFVKSSKQKINTKLSTEAEVVGISDSLSQAVWTREFLQEQGYVMGATQTQAGYRIFHNLNEQGHEHE
jgi:hypothetical protein